MSFLSCFPCWNTCLLKPKEDKTNKINISPNPSAKYKCPILKLYMQDPIKLYCPDDCVIDKLALRELKKKDECPVCHKIFFNYLPIKTLKHNIAFYLREHPSQNDVKKYLEKQNALEEAEKQKTLAEQTPSDTIKSTSNDDDKEFQVKNSEKISPFPA